MNSRERSTAPWARNPKILPWLAHKAGVPFERAEGLWRDSVAETDRAGLVVGTPEAAEFALARLEAKLAEEAEQRRDAPFGFGAWFHLPITLGLLGVAANEAIYQATARNWQAASRQHCRLC